MSRLTEIDSELWDQAWIFSYPDVVSKSNYRKGEDWRKYKEYAQNLHNSIEFKLLQEMNWDSEKWLQSDKKLPKRPNVALAMCSRTFLDSDNSMKSVQDALQGIFYATDASVRRSTAQTERLKPISGSDNVVVGVCRLSEGASVKTIHKASVALETAVIQRFQDWIQNSCDDDLTNV